MARGKKKEVLSPRELQNLEEEKREIDDTLSTVDGSRGMEQYGQGTPAGQIDRAALERQRGALDRAIHDGSPARLSGSSKDKIAQEASALEDKIKAGMPTRAEMEQPQRHPGAVQKQMQWEARSTQDVLRWRQMQRSLNPGDPTCSSVERLRREK